ncbi:MAG: VCBS repeat-containing protein [Thermoplasmata archaeon]|nr:VCBS repeat-containing protein [Thermoplasmata archaeon]
MARWLPLLAAFLVVTATAAVTNAQGGLRIVASTMGSIEVPPMGYYAIRVDPETGQITPMELHQEPLPAAAQEALQRVPKWIRPLLERQFRLLMQDYMVLEGNSRPAVGDINGDGLPDLIVGASDGTLHVYINVGNAIEPLFKEMEVISLGGLIGEDPGSVVTPALGDADGDSLVDIVVGVESGSVYLLKNTGTQGSPSWGLEADYFAGVSVSGNATPFLWDADGDGDLDLVMGSSDGVIHCYLNQGSPAAPVWVEDPEYFPAWLEDWWDGRGPHYEGVWVGNNSRPVLFTWGSDLYLVVGADDGSVYAFRSASFVDHPSWEELGALEGMDVSSLSSPWVSDLDGDGVPDLILGSSDGGVYFAKNFGGLGFRAWPSGAERYLLANWFWGPAYYPKLDLLRVTGLNTEIVEYYANIILQIPDEYVDEVAYGIAVERPANLVMFYYNGGSSLYALNARTIYQIAEELPYVEVVEKGDYTTLRYRTEEGWDEVPREVYYKYLVTFSRYIVAPWAWPSRYGGNFFRTFLPYNDTYGVRLIDRVREAETLRDAAYLVDYWLRVDIGAVWHPGPKGKPPGWYNIYLHLTDANYSILCGEFSIIYEVSARAVLIPTINIVDIAEDHQFNNFWYEGRWHHVDASSGSPGENGSWAEYFDPPRGLAGWYKNIGFSYPIEWEENGLYDPPWRSQVEYAPEGMLADLHFKVVDETGRPVDGARVEVWSHWTIESGYDTAPYIAGLVFTDMNGEAEFPMLGLGRTHNFTVVATSRIGSTMFKIHLEKGGDYSFTIRIPGRLPEPPRAKQLETPTGTPYYISASLTVTGAEQNPPTWIHVLYAYFDYKYYVEFSKGFWADFYVVPEGELQDFLSFGTFGSYATAEHASSFSPEAVPVDGPVYIIISNRESITTYVKVSYEVSLMVDEEAPTVEITSPEDGALIASDSVTVTFTSYSGDVDHFEISVDGSPFVPAESPYTVTGLEDGTHTISVRAVDVSGNVGPASTVTVVVDTTPPSIELRDVADGQVFTEDNITVHGRILGAAEAYLNGEPLELAEDGSFEVTVHLVDGLNTLSFTARDEAGNEATLTVRVYHYPELATASQVEGLEQEVQDLESNIGSQISDVQNTLSQKIQNAIENITSSIGDLIEAAKKPLWTMLVITIILVIIAIIAVIAIRK